MRTPALVLYLLLAGSLSAQELSAFDYYEQGRAAEKSGHMSEAYLAYARAAALEPENKSYWQHSQSIRFRATLEAGSPAQLPLITPILPGEEDAPPAIRQATLQDRVDARSSCRRRGWTPDVLPRFRPEGRFQATLRSHRQDLRPHLHFRP